MLSQAAASIITQLIRKFYESSSGLAPAEVARREFGFGDYERKIAFRHYAFASEASLKRYLVESAPPFVSYSAAFYAEPAARPMERKGFIGAELIFDLDATDLRLPCQSEHGRDWVCEKDFEAVRAETLRLIEDFLIPDFGFSEKELLMNFSGNRGYHVHVASGPALELSADARREVSEYISGSGLDPDEIFRLVPLPKRGGGKRLAKVMGPRPTDGGWPGRIAKTFLANLGKGKEALTAMDIDAGTAGTLYKKRALIEMGVNSGNWDMVYIKDKSTFWRKVAAHQAIAQSDSIDKNVTKDLHHLIRLPGTLHGDTGLIAKRIGSVAELGGFDPMNDAIAFTDGSVRVKTASVMAFHMRGEQFGPYNDTVIEVPTYAAAYMILKRVAEPA
ncbi:MAG: hypothetical protein M1474_03165 [Candidatus Marsarchaeota archaeon]|nr:hypothetical protein [Candidatus Marsarchaeota archaeon]